MGPATRLAYPRQAWVRAALADHFAGTGSAALSAPIKLKHLTPVWDQRWEVLDLLSASQKQRARSATETPVSRALCGSGQLISTRTSALRADAALDADSDDAPLDNLARLQ